MNHIYLDANSTTRLDEQVLQAMTECFEANYVNPASQHQPGQFARRRLEIARAAISSRLGAGNQDRLVFTSGGTEANNLALIGLSGGLLQPPVDEIPEIVVSSIEHPSVMGAADFLGSRGFIVRRIPVDNSGRVETKSLPDLITPQTRLVSLMWANNETGVIQDIAGVAEICFQRGVPLHCDAVQAVGKIPVDFSMPGLSAMTVTAHKLHGPRGIGGLLVADHANLQPTMFGGFQQLGQRPGTEDVALAVGFAEAVTLAVDALDVHAGQMEQLRDLFEQTILAELPNTVINGLGMLRVPHTSNISFPGHGEFETVNRQALMMAADAAEVAISTGSACASGSSEPSLVLTAMGCPEDVIESSIRVSLGRQTKRAEVLEGGHRIINAIKRLRRQKSRRN